MHGRLRQAVLRRLRFQQPIAMRRQGGTQESTNLRFVFDNQNRRSRACHKHSSICEADLICLREGTGSAATDYLTDVLGLTTAYTGTAVFRSHGTCSVIVTRLWYWPSPAQMV